MVGFHYGSSGPATPLQEVQLADELIELRIEQCADHQSGLYTWYSYNYKKIWSTFRKGDQKVWVFFVILKLILWKKHWSNSTQNYQIFFISFFYNFLSTGSRNNYLCFEHFINPASFLKKNWQKRIIHQSSKSSSFIQNWQDQTFSLFDKGWSPITKNFKKDLDRVNSTRCPLLDFLDDSFINDKYWSVIMYV